MENNSTNVTLPVPTKNKKHNDDNDDVYVEDNTNILITCKDNTGKYIYMIFHIIMAFIAIYLSWKCNNGNFDILSFLIALFFPYVYIIYILATRGTCDKI
jgi:hypothetical protein